MKTLKKSAYMVLTVLRKRSMSGYDLKKTLASIGRYFWSESNAQIYPTLKELEREGLVSSDLDASSGKRQRRTYQLTDAGKQGLINWLAAPCDATPYREEILLKLIAANDITDEEMMTNLEYYEDNIKDALEGHKATLTFILEDKKDSPDQENLLFIYNHVQAILEAKYQWVKDTMNKVELRQS